MPTTLPRASLYCTEGTSDKVYQTWIEEKDGGYILNYANGRRGSTLQTGTKTKEPLPLEKATKEFDKLVKSKLAKGYKPTEEGGATYSAPDSEEAKKDTGVRHQLLNAIEESEAKCLLGDSDFVMQEKKDGKRIAIQRLKDGTIRAINRKGLVVGLSSDVEMDAKEIPGEWLIDGEAIGDVLHAFDLLQFGKGDMRGLSYNSRIKELYKLLAKYETTSIVAVDTWATSELKRKHFERLKDEKAEGVVFKRGDCAWSAGRPNKGGPHLKYKFYATASAIVAEGREGKRSVALVLLDGEKRIPVGNVTIPPNYEVPKVAAVVEVRYLYAYKGGSLFQPTYLGERDDVDASNCVVGQLKYKAEGGDEE